MKHTATSKKDLDLKDALARMAELHAALDIADCTQREGGDVRHCGEVRCWRCRAEAAEERVDLLEESLRYVAHHLEHGGLYGPWEEPAKMKVKAALNASEALAERQKVEDGDACERGTAGNKCEAGNECGRVGCPECQQ